MPHKNKEVRQDLKGQWQGRLGIQNCHSLFATFAITMKVQTVIHRKLNQVFILFNTKQEVSEQIPELIRFKAHSIKLV